MRRVILESPFAGASKWGIIAATQRAANIDYARRCVRDSLLRGEAPIASHLLYTQPGILNDALADERAHGIEAGLSWYAAAEAAVVYCDRGISRGMVQGILRAGDAGLPVEYRALDWRATMADADTAAMLRKLRPHLVAELAARVPGIVIAFGDDVSAAERQAVKTAAESCEHECCGQYRWGGGYCSVCPLVRPC